MRSFAHDISGMPVEATDGEIGTVKDLLFDPDSWTVRYVEVSTGWLFGRDVIVPVDKVTSIDIPEGAVTFDLTKQQVENSPPAETERPVRRDYESRLLAHYGMTPYWAAPPEVGVPPQALSIDTPKADLETAPRLIFAGDLDGYDLDAKGDIIGTVRDILIDLDTWKVTSLMADLGGLLVRDSATIGVGPVAGIDAENRVVHVSVPKERIEKRDRLSVEDLPYVFPYIPPVA